jgi:chemotaxis family two-component system response regulator Rcp1
MNFLFSERNAMHFKSMERDVELLLVEDNPADVLLMEEALREDRMRFHLHVVTNGDEAIDFLYRRGGFAKAVRPDLIMLDLNLPKKDGREVLAEIKNDPDLKNIPVLVITTSKSQEDVLKSYDLHANCYITKPVRLNQFLEMMKCIEHFWFGLVTLPPRDKRG